MNREGRQSHVVRCLGRRRHHRHHRRHRRHRSRLRRYGIHHRRRGDRVRPCCLRWYAWGRVVHPRRGLHCDGRGCCVRGGFPDGHWPVEAVHRRSERNCRGVGHGCVQMPVERCRDLHHHLGQHGFHLRSGLGCVGRCHFQTVHRRHCLGEGCVRLGPGLPCWCECGPSFRSERPWRQPASLRGSVACLHHPRSSGGPWR